MRVKASLIQRGSGATPEFQQAIFVMLKRLHSRNEDTELKVSFKERE
ncbi:MAG: hypothetical protein WC770_03105 [Phycisphaerae bacterium]